MTITESDRLQIEGKKIKPIKIETMKTIQGNQALFDSLCSRAGFGDLKPADRSGDKPLQRQAVWYAMRERGVTFQEIAKQSHRTHGTVFSGVKRFKGFLSVNDKEAVQTYQNVVKVAQNGKE